MKLYKYDLIKDGGIYEKIFDLCDGNAANYNAVMDMDLKDAAIFMILKEKFNFEQWYAKKLMEEFNNL